MAGHNKWSKVKRLKGALDAKRGKLFSRLSKEIAVAARLGGGNPAFNPRLRAAVLAARSQSMPNDNIERAIKKGCGETEAGAMEEIVYEGYAPGGVAVLVESATDNRNRTAADLRSIFTKHDGALGTSGSVAFLFHRVGEIHVPAGVPEERVFETVTEAGADDLAQADGELVVTTPPDRLYTVAEALRAVGIESTSQRLTYIPQTLVPVTDPETAGQLEDLTDALEECDDVLNVHTNADFDEAAVAEISN